MAPIPPPSYGSGPVNFANQGDAGPFAAFDNTINYQNMLRYQMVTQYNQQSVTPYNMPANAQRNILTNPSFSYGVNGGQDPSYYNRQVEGNRTAYSAALATGALGWGAWSGAASAATAMGFKGMTGAFVAPMILSMPLTAMIAKRADEIMDRQKYMSSIALDLQMNRDKLGMRGLTYGEASALGGRLADNMMQKTPGGRQAGFFSPDQMMKIHKIGVGEGMLNAAGQDAGSIRQYEKNFKELVSATEDIVKTLKTTIEGGMSLIKEVNQIGFTSLPQIKSQIRAAKALGTATGMGFQNTMQMASAGAQAVQGTPWNASVGASMYQMGGLAAYTMAGASAAGSRAVERVGGVAQAGATIANAQMNILSSGIGTRVAAAVMNSQGGLDQSRLNDMLSGRMSAYQTVSRANATGYAMGDNRVRFEAFKQDLLNNLSDQERAGLTRQSFRMWGNERRGSLENKAWVFAGQYTNNINDQRVMAESLLGSSGYNMAAGAAAYESFMGADVSRMRINSRGMRVLGAMQRAVRDPIYGAVDATVAGMNYGTKMMGNVVGGIGNMGAGLINNVLSPIDKYGVINTSRSYTKDVETSARLGYGIAHRGNLNENLRAYNKAIASGESLPTIPQMNLGIDWDKLVRGKSPAEINEILKMTSTRIMAGTAGEAIRDSNLQRFLGIKFSERGITAGAMTSLLSTVNTGLLGATTSMNQRFKSTAGEFDNWMAKQSAVNQAGLYVKMGEARQMLNMASGQYETSLDKTGKSMTIRAGNMSMELPAAMGRKITAEQDYHRISKNVQGVRASSVDYANAEKSAVNTIKESLTAYQGGFGLGFSNTYDPSRSDGSFYQRQGGSASLDFHKRKMLEGNLKTFGGVTKSMFRAALAGWESFSIKGRMAVDLAGVGNRLGVKLDSNADILAFAENVADIEARSKTDAITDKKEIARLNFAKTKPGEAVLKAVADLKKTSGYQSLEGLVNQGAAMGVSLKVSQLAALSGADPTAAAKAIMPQLMAMTGQTEESVLRLAKIKGDGGLVSQLYAKQISAQSTDLTSKAAQLKGNLALMASGSLSKALETNDLIIGGTTIKKGEKTSEAELAKLVKQSEAEFDLDWKVQMAAGGTGKSGNTTSVSTPILNYWNNRWVL